MKRVMNGNVWMCKLSSLIGYVDIVSSILSDLVSGCSDSLVGVRPELSVSI